MKDLPPNTSGEQDRLPINFGDVVYFRESAKPFSSTHPYLVILVRSNGTLEAMALPDEDNPTYGVAGTEQSSDVKEIIDHFDFDKVVECVARSFIPEPTPEFIAQIGNSLKKDIEEHS